MTTEPDYGPNRSTPHNVEAEEAALGCVLINPESFDDLDLQASDFYLHKHRWIFEAMATLRRDRMQLDIITISQALERANHLPDVGGAAYLAKLIDSVPTSLHAAAYGRLIREEAERRDLIALATEIAKDAYDLGRKPSEVRQAVMRRVVSAERVTGGADHISTYLDKLYDEVKANAENPQDVFGLATGFKDFDDITGGLQKGEVFLLVGEPGSGKSLLLAQMAMQLAGWRPYAVAAPVPAAAGSIYEMEMGGIQLIRRNVSAASGIPRRVLRNGRLQDNQWPAFVQAMGDLNTLPVYLSDATGMTTATLRADLSRLVDLYGIEWAVIDYLKLLKDRYGKDETERTAYISAELHAIAKDLNLSICTIQHLVKTGMQDSVPNLRDIGGSVLIGYDADVVAVITEHLSEPGEMANDRIRTITFRKFREDDTRQLFNLIFDKGIPILRDLEYRTIDLRDDTAFVRSSKPRDTLKETVERQKRGNGTGKSGRTLNLDNL